MGSAGRGLEERICGSSVAGGAEPARRAHRAACATTGSGEHSSPPPLPVQPPRKRSLPGRKASRPPLEQRPAIGCPAGAVALRSFDWPVTSDVAGKLLADWLRPLGGGSGRGFVTGVRALRRLRARAPVLGREGVAEVVSLRRQSPSWPRRRPPRGGREGAARLGVGRGVAWRGGPGCSAALPPQPHLTALPSDSRAAGGCCRSRFAAPGWAAVDPGGLGRCLVRGTRLAFQ